ncbi:hypothetical protein AwErysi_09760 [Erysipelotrichaceae bacterium]|nr:hypothetical protein AwErysi_09760 [Erysipelotrichaceae bacterium]
MIKHIELAELESKKGLIIDVREVYEYAAYHMPEAINIPAGVLLENPTQYLDKDKTYYIICAHAVRSEKVCNILVRQGYDTVNVLSGMSCYL